MHFILFHTSSFIIPQINNLMEMHLIHAADVQPIIQRCNDQSFLRQNTSLHPIEAMELKEVCTWMTSCGSIYTNCTKKAKHICIDCNVIGWCSERCRKK